MVDSQFWFDLGRFFSSSALLETGSSLAPILFITVFLIAAAAMVWRLGVMESRGFEGTVLGTLVMPYCSGLSNLIFALVMAQIGHSGQMVLENCLVNNVTNLTLLLGLPALIWGLDLFPGPRKVEDGKKGKLKKPTKAGLQAYRLNRLALALTLIAVFFFTGICWVLSRDGRLDQSDGLVLIAIFAFWQLFQVMEVLKRNVQQKHGMGWILIVDILILGVCAYLTYWSVDGLVLWLGSLGDGFWGTAGMGWISGWLMVLPNAMLAIYYAKVGRSDIAYSSQVGDGHICIPLCIGLYALFAPVQIPDSFIPGLQLLLGSTVLHLVLIIMIGRLPRWVGALLCGGYVWFVVTGTMI